MIFYLQKGETLLELAAHPDSKDLIATLAQDLNHLQHSNHIDKRIAITIATRPKFPTDQRIHFTNSFREYCLQMYYNTIRGLIKHIFKVPYKADGLIIWSGFFFFEKRYFTQLLLVDIYLISIVIDQCFK